MAAQLAREAKKAQNSGQLVRAYMLYNEAAARDPLNQHYRMERDGVAPAARLLSKANVEQPVDISEDIRAAENGPTDQPDEASIHLANAIDLQQAARLQGLPQLRASGVAKEFSLRGETKTLFDQVAQVYGVRVIFDKDLEAGAPIKFEMAASDFRTAMEALTDATGTFLFPISPDTIYVAKDSEPKRTELEPNVVFTVPLPESIDAKDLTDAANAVRSTLNLRSLVFDSATRTVIVRDRVSKARVARSMLEALLLPRAQVSLEVELLSVDSDVSYHYGLSLPTSYQLLDLGRLGLKSVFNNYSSATTFFGFGGGATLFGIGLSEATVFARYSKSFTRSLYDAIVVAGDGQAATFHVGDKYPIPTAIYSGFQQQSTSASLYNPIGPVTYEDLGLAVKLTPHVNGSGEVSLDVEADFKSLGTLTIDTVPSVNQRTYKGSVRIAEGEWAILAGIDQSTRTVTRNGLLGLSQIPGVDQILSENNTDSQRSQTLLVIKPEITRLPMSGLVNPQYLIGPEKGMRVLL